MKLVLTPRICSVSFSTRCLTKPLRGLADGDEVIAGRERGGSVGITRDVADPWTSAPARWRLRRRSPWDTHSVSWFVLARELAAKGYFPTLYLTPSALSCSSVFPTQATSGWV